MQYNSDKNDLFESCWVCIEKDLRCPKYAQLHFTPHQDTLHKHIDDSFIRGGVTVW